jgi:flagellar basal-body rod modification protein FlgD
MTSVSGTGSSSSSTTSTADRYSSLKVSDFIELLVTELTNQDPTEPVDTSTILEEVSMIKSIQSEQDLTDTLDNMDQSTNIASAANLIGRKIKGLDSSSDTVTGTVDSVTIDGDTVTLKVGNSEVDLSNVSEIESDS